MADQRTSSPLDGLTAALAQRRTKARQTLHFLHFDSPSCGKPDETNSTERLTKNLRRSIFNRMVEQRLDTTFAALADPTRRGMLAALAQGECSIGDLAEPYRMSFAGAAKHVGVLERAGLVERRKAGRQQLCRLKAEPLAEAEAWLRQWQRFWSESLGRLEALLTQEQERAE
jgi:DNA-binding transcriptional ArsR family regulator